jgi:hypothetical protein
LNQHQWARLLLIATVVITVSVAWTASSALGVPAMPGFNASLLGQPALSSALLGVAVVLLIGAGISGLLLGRVHHEATVFGAAAALSVVSLRGGGIRYVLYDGGSPGVLLRCAVETFILGAVLFGVWLASRPLCSRGLLRETLDLPNDDDHEPIDQRLLGTATHVAMMVVLLKFSLVTQDKPQVLAGVGLSALLASLVAHQFVPTRPGAWYWSSPILVGVIGYVGSYFGTPSVQPGDPQGFFAPLARPLPVDYASAGVAGALLGYWMRRRKVMISSQQSDCPAPDASLPSAGHA